MRVIGIDPGANGGIAVLDEYGKIKSLMPYDEYDLRETITDLMFMPDEKIAGFIEKVHAMPGQGVTSMFSFGSNFGYIRGVAEAKGLPYELIEPKRWEKEFSLIGKTKDDAIHVAEHLFPEADLRKTERCTKKHDGMADALLIAEYGRRTVCGERRI